MSITFGFINNEAGHRIGISLGDSPARSVRIMDNMLDAEIAECLRELSNAYDPGAVPPKWRPLPEWIEAETLAYGRAELTIHGKSVTLVGKPDVDLPAVAAAVAPGVKPPGSVSEWATMTGLFARNLPLGTVIVYMEHDTADALRTFCAVPISNTVLAGRLNRVAASLMGVRPLPVQAPPALPMPLAPPPAPLYPAPGEPPARGVLDLAEWQCVSSALGLAVAMLEGKPIEVIKAAQALAVTRARR